MNQYRIMITLSNGDKVDAKVAAENQSAAIKRITSESKFIEFVKNLSIEDINIQLIGEYKEVDDTDRFVLSKSKEKNDWYVVTDTRTMIIIRFEQGRFNDTNEITPLNDIDDIKEVDIATSLRETSEWLVMYHPELL